VPLKRSTEKPYLGREGVYFRMEDHAGKRVTCSVGPDVLRADRPDDGTASKKGLMSRFQELRNRLERRASALYDEGQVQPRIDTLG